MSSTALSIRPFIGAKDYDLSRSFYRDLGFTECNLGDSMSVFELGSLAFYLQKYYSEEWVNNTMVFLEVDNVQAWWEKLLALDLPAKYPGVKLVPIRIEEWGSECFLHDPSGVLWHIGAFRKE